MELERHHQSGPEQPCLTPTPGRGLRLFDIALQVTLGGLVVASVLFALTAVLVPAGRLDVTFDAEVEPPYGVSTPDREVRVAEDGSVEWLRGKDEDDDLFEDPLTAVTEARLDAGDTDARIAVVVLTGSWLALAWVGYVALRRVADTARAGNPFAAENPRRARWLAGTLLVAAPVTTVLTFAIEVTADTTHQLNLMPGTWAWILPVVAGLAVLGLAEVLDAGVKLQDFERSAI